MKIILTKQVNNLGNLGDQVEVKEGYALNFLFPNDLALPTTRNNIKCIINQKLKEEAKNKEIKEKVAIEKKEKKSKKEKREERKKEKESKKSNKNILKTKNQKVK